MKYFKRAILVFILFLDTIFLIAPFYNAFPPGKNVEIDWLRYIIIHAVPIAILFTITYLIWPEAKKKNVE